MGWFKDEIALEAIFRIHVGELVNHGVALNVDYTTRNAATDFVIGMSFDHDYGI